jgi:uncharacterized repeat protein (TIGR03943 family)
VLDAGEAAVNREAQDTLLLFVGVMVLQVGISDLHLRYVKPVMQIPLVLSGAILAVIAIVSIVRSQRRGAREDDHVVTPSPTEHVPGGMLHAVDDPSHEDEHGHSHAHMPRTAWLLALPLIVLTVITPPTLGAYAAARGTQGTVDAPSVELPPLPPATDGAVDLTLTDYVTRALYAPDSLAGVDLRLTGFVLPEDDGWAVARIAMSCCAADGRALRVQVLGAQSPGADTWVAVQGRFRETEGEGARRIARLEATSVREVDPPREQYE